ETSSINPRLGAGRPLLDSDQIAKALAELSRRQGDTPGQFVQRLRAFEVRPFEANHVMAGALVGFAIHVYLAHRHATRLRVEHLLERQRNHFTVLETDNSA